MSPENTSIFSVIIPAYNEEKGIVEVLDNLKFLDANYEIIVVDDGSVDKTSEAVRKYANVRLITHSRNSGYGASLKTGIKHSSGDIIIITDADSTYPVERIPEFVSILADNDFDMVVGARTGENVNIPPIRKPAKWMISRLANYLAGINIPDLNSGFRIIKKEAVKNFISILPNGYSFTTTITLAMTTNAYNVKYVPINYLKRTGKSKIRPIKDTLNFIQLIVRTTLYFDPLKIFIPVSLAMFGASFLVFIYSYFFIPTLMDTTVAIFFISGIQILAIGMVADLINRKMK
ncbi:MAG: glycosyltransferase family 2 protein [Nitrospiraceae bacterium]|nr:MAG: glycosyltransferase family 2 protein [Nitrospiraceae bacterium]